VVVVGGGFGGISAVRELADAPVEVTLVDRRNFHLFQPLLYQVATGALSDDEIASPLRAMLSHQRNATVLLGDVQKLDLDARRITHVGSDGVADELAYDSLIVSAGAGHSYFGHDEWEAHAPGLKTLEDALNVRGHILGALELAEREPAARDRWLTFVVVGGGPTGVELAGQLGEITRETMPRDFRRIDTRHARIVLIEQTDMILASYGKRLSARAERDLARLGVQVHTQASVVDIQDGLVRIERDGRVEDLAAGTVLWAAGVSASPLARLLGEASGAEVDRAGRVSVAPDLTLPDHPEVFAIGDMVRVRDRAGKIKPLPGIAQPAIQEGGHAARTITARLKGAKPPGEFRYFDKGNLATIGRARAIADLRGVRFGGLPAWLIWLTVHIFFLNGMQNRIIVFMRWTASFVTYGRDARIIFRTSESPDR
jgi:NADH dehydrogenase